MIEGLFQPTHLIVILLVALLVLGPKRLPGAGRALGETFRDFKDAISGDKQESTPAVHAAYPQPPVVQTPPVANAVPTPAAPAPAPEAPTSPSEPTNVG